MGMHGLDYWFDGLGNFPALDQAECLQLARQVQLWLNDSKPDRRTVLRGQVARDRLIRHNLRLIPHLWKTKFQYKIPIDHPGIQDAFQVASLNLTFAANKFDPAKNTRFSTYASFWVMKGFRDYLMNEDRLIHMPEHNHAIVKYAYQIVCDAINRGQPLPTMEEVCKKISETRKHVPRPDQLRCWLLSYAHTNTVSTDEKVLNHSEYNKCLIDQIEYIDPKDREEDQELESIRAQLQNLDDSEMIVIESLYFSADGRAHQACRQLNLSASRVHQIKVKALAKLSHLVAVNC